MSKSKKPNLKIQIEEPNDQVTSSFVAPVPIIFHEYEHYEHYDDQLEKNRLIKKENSYNSLHSQASNQSNREQILSRAKKQIVQNRLSRNVQSLNKLNQMLVKSRLSSRKSYASSRNDNQSEINKSRSITELQNSRTKILKDIAEKIKDNKNKYVSLQNSRDIKQQKTPKKQVKKLNKLGTLLNDVKKHNQESYNIVYTIKKSKKVMKSPQKIQHSSYYKQSETNEIKKLTKELSDIKQELKEAKRKNQQLIKISKIKDQTLKNKPYSRQSQQKLLPSYQQSISSNHFLSETYHREEQQYLNIGGQSFYRISKPEFVQPCLACGCICRGNSLKHTN